uniref:Apolipoprotein B n=1 Tax=Seriola lalandi dorsalis TaxID=1841481 RepID=A0A3B4XVK3_SERLL
WPMMGYRKLCLLLLLSSYTLALASKFKAYKKYVYQYTTETRNGMVGTANLGNGPKVSCQVEIEIPQTCRFIMHTRDCVLSEVSIMDPEDQPIYRHSPSSHAFQSAMEKLFTVEDITSVHLYPETDEPVNILNIKRGIVSTLIVPVMEDEQNSLMSTVHGQCLTDHLVNGKNIATDVTLSRDLSQCDQFYRRESAYSPLALLQTLHYPMSKLITSTQDCNYQFDNNGKHIMAAMCTEKHIYKPFSHEDNGISSVVTQELSFQSSKRTNNRVFGSKSKPLHFEDPDNKAPVQTKDTVLSSLRDLVALAGTDRGQKRTSLFHKLVSSLRVLRNETLSQTVTEMIDTSGWLTYQALLQCGTPECTSAILQAIRTIDGGSLQVDALVYGLSLWANPDAVRVRDMLSMAQYKQSKAIMYALANTVKNFGVTDKSVLIRESGSGLQCPKLILFSNLQVVGVMGPAMQVVSPSLISSILRCAQKTDIPLSNQKAAIQAFRLMDINDEVRNVLMEVYQDTQSSLEKRIAAYLILMKSPHQTLVQDIVNNLENVRNEQLKSFVISHLNNIRNFDKPQIQIKLGTSMSQNYKINSPMGSVQSNIIFDGRDTLPKEVMLETTLKVFDYNYDIFEVSVEGRGFEPTIDALFGERGFFPDSISRVMYWAGDKAQMLRDVLNRIAPDRDRMKREVPQDLLKDITNSARKLMDDVHFSQAPEAIAYLRLLGNEIGYLKTSEMRKMALLSLISSTENEVFAHYIFIESAFSLPTASGLPLKFSLAGVFAPGAKGGLIHSGPNIKTDLSFMPSVGLEFITQMGVHIPAFVEAGLEMHTNMYHESSINAKITMNRHQLRLSIPAPKSNTQLLSVSNKLLSVFSGQTKIVPSLVEDHTDSAGCQPLFSGLKLCTILRNSNATSIYQAPYYPLTGETRFAVEIQPTGEISEYTATITDETLREGKKGRHKVQSLKLTLKAEGDNSTEATASLKYNHNKNIFTAEVAIPDYDVEAGIKLALTDSDAKGKKMRGITIDVTNRNIPQLSLVGRTRYVETHFVASISNIFNREKRFETFIHYFWVLLDFFTDDDKFELELKSELNSEFQKLIPDGQNYHGQLHQLIDDVLDQKVAKTDMKLRHIVTKGIEVVLGHLMLYLLPLSGTHVFRYQFNKDKMAISLPLPLGGKKLEELNISTTLSIPYINLPEIGLYFPAKNYPLPSITIPPSLDFNIPLLGLAEASTKINSNFYHWEGSISGGNNTFDFPSYIVQYKAMAQSPLNLLAYKLEGTAMMSGNADDNLKYLLNSSFSHSFIDTSFSVLETLRVTDKLNAKANYKLEASSPVGLQASIYYSAQSTSTLNSNEVSGDGTMNGLFNIGSFYTNTSFTHSYNLHPLDQVGRGESTLHFDSPFIQVHNMIHGVYTNSELNIVSKTNAQRDILKHVAELKYKDAKLTLKCHAIATGMGKALNNKVELGVSSHMAILTIESQADDDANRAYSLITGSLDSNGLELNSEASLTFDTGRGLHKASVMVGRNGLTTSGINSILCSSVTVENIFNGAIDNNGASMSSMTKAIAEESRGELNIEGKVTAAEASLYGVFKGHAYNATTRNNINIALNHRALTFTSNTMGTLKQMKTENSHTLTLTLWTLALHSKTNNFICEDIYYKQDTNVDMKPFVMSLYMTNDLKFHDISLNNNGHMTLKPLKVDLSGSMKVAYGEEHVYEHIIHTYELTYDDMAGTMKYNMSGDVFGAKLSHNCELQFAGLSSTTNCEAQLKSEPLHFDSTIRTMALPFSFTIDALVNSEGEVNLCGKHKGQLYNKLLVKAEPLAFAYSHDSRVSTTHKLPSWEASINVDNKCDGLLAPSDQHLTWTVRSILNDHAYNQDIHTYNNPEKIGFEFSGAILTDIFSKLSKEWRSVPELQEFSMAGFLKYDKNSDSHIIKIPFIESLPAAFEELRNTLVKALESLQQSINNLDINKQIADFRTKLDFLQVQVSNFMQDIDLENNVNQLKAKFDYLIGEFAVTIDDLELVMNNLSKNLENIVMDVATKIRDIILTIKKYLKAGHLTVKITNILSKTGNQLRAFDEKYEIKQSFVKALHVIEDIIRQIHLQKFTECSTAWLCELDSKYRILDKIRDNLSLIKQAIENFDIDIFFNDVKDYLLSFDLAIHVEQLSYKIPSLEIAKVIESMNDVIVNWIDEYEIPNKLNAVYSYNKDLLLKYKLDDKLKELMDQIIILIKELKIEETVQSVVGALQSINFEFFYGKTMQFLHSVTNQLKGTDFKKSIDDLNEQISSMLKLMKEFDYSKFVDRTNENIAELTNYINKQIKSYEIVQKIEAVRDFFREIQSSIITYLDELKNTKVADALKKLKNVIDTTFYNDIKMKVQDILEDIRQRIIDMDIRNEIHIHIQRAIESYSNMVAYISVQFNRLIQTIRKVVKDSKIITQMKQTVDGALGALKRPDIKVGTFTVPFTDLVIAAFSVNLNKLQEISIPARISVPEFTIFYFYTIPAFTIDFDEIKAKIVAIIDDIKEFKIKMPDPEEIFGDLKVLYLSELPDLTFPEITLSEITFPAINIPKLNLKEFRITVLPIPEIKLPEVPNDICIPIFGKFHGEFRINFPQYTLVTAGKIENSTSTQKNPQFTATIVSHVQSPFEPLKYTFEAMAQLGAPRMKKLLFTGTVKAEHMAFSIDHEGFLTLTGSSVEASAKTTTKATTQMYTAHLDNNMALTLKGKISASIDTAYNHNLDIASIETSSQASMKQNIAATMESGTITVTGQTTGNGKWSIKDYSDGGTHTSNVDFNLNLSTAKLIFVGESDCQALKLKQTLTAESVILSHITVEARCETEVPSIKKSVMILNGQTRIGDLKVALTASHDAEFSGSLIGSMSNSLEFMAHPFEIVLNVKNQVNSKIFLPLKLTGKVDLLNDYGVSLNSEKQHACWFALARFNQYKYNHNFTAANNEMDIFFHTSANVEANLDFLTVPVSFPEITVPYIEMKTPAVRHISLWEQAGLKTLLTTPQQSFDMYLKLHYYKNPDMHNNELHLELIYNAISGNANIIQDHFEQYRDRVVALIKDSYNQAKSQYIKHNTDTSSLPPRIFTVPGYKIPILNIDISAFRAEMPAFSYFVPKEVSTPRFKVPALGFSVPSYTLVVPSFQLPVIHVPETLSEIKLPNLTLPAIQNNIVIPAMGNLTCDFSFKSTVITLSANAGLYNQSDIVARFGASSTSVFDILNAEIDGTTSLTRKRGIKLATTVSVEHNNVEANHESAVSINKRSMESSVSNTAKVSLPFLSLELNQELIGNTKTKLNVVSKKKIKYMFNIPLIESVGKGNLDINMALEALSHVSLETSTQGKSDIIIMGGCHFSGDLENEASFCLNANLLRSTKQKRSSNNKILQFDLNKNLDLEVSLRRIFATVHYTSNNNIDSASFNTNGRHFIKGELDFVPLTTFKTTLNIDGSQPSSLGHAGLIQSINLAITSDKQSITWSGKEQLASLIHACDLFMSNDESQVCMDLTGSVEGHLAFLKAVRLPVYQKTLWDVFKFDQVTNMDNLQFLNISYSILYTKAMDGQQYAIPSKLFENGITFSIPEISINLHIPKVITTKAYDIMLPGLPIMSVPSYDINTEYLQGKMSFLSFKMPQYEITVSSFTPPKTFTIREHTISLNENTSQILNFELPTSLLSEQTFEIPEMALHLPFGVFIPVFGALSAILNVSSPIYNVSTTANLEKKDSSLKLLPVSLFYRESNHTLTADITSQKFTDVSFRFASHKYGITATMSSPSTGFLGLHFQQRSPSQLYGKLFNHYLVTH